MQDIGPSSTSQVLLLLPLIAAAVGWYIASRLAVSAVDARGDCSTRRGAALCIPVLLLSMAALFAHQPLIAVGAVFGSCVAALSLVLGVVTFTSPPRQIHADARRKWGLVLPAAMLVFLAGYQSQFTLLHAGVLFIEGVAILLVGNGPAVKTGKPAKPVPARSIWLAPAFMVLAVAVSAIAGWGAVHGSARLLERSNLPSMSIIAALLLGPALVIPMIGASALLAQKGRYTDAVSAQVAFVLTNLCVVLPMVIVVWRIESALPLKVSDLWRADPTVDWNSIHAFWMRIMAPPNEMSLSFPLVVWRVDSVMLLVLGLALLPMSLGRWLPGRIEGVILIVLYGAYMLLWRWASTMA